MKLYVRRVELFRLKNSNEFFRFEAVEPDSGRISSVEISSERKDPMGRRFYSPKELYSFADYDDMKCAYEQGTLIRRPVDLPECHPSMAASLDIDTCIMGFIDDCPDSRFNQMVAIHLPD